MVSFFFCFSYIFRTNEYKKIIGAESSSVHPSPVVFRSSAIQNRHRRTTDFSFFVRFVLMEVLSFGIQHLRSAPVPLRPGASQQTLIQLNILGQHKSKYFLSRNLRHGSLFSQGQVLLTPRFPLKPALLPRKEHLQNSVRNTS